LLFSDNSAFEALFRENYAKLCRVAFRIVQDEDTAEDIVQDVFVKVWEKRSELRIATTLNGYIYQSVLNASIKRLKKDRNTAMREELFGSQLSRDANTTDELLAARELTRRTRSAVDLLPAACREVFILSRYEQMSYREIAETLEISVKTVENQMGKALKHLRKYLVLCTFLLSCFSLGWKKNSVGIGVAAGQTVIVVNDDQRLRK
jgi:RNA polymerase sigma-70 factor (ECF subfamily)